jgi:hypothetical protein
MFKTTILTAVAFLGLTTALDAQVRVSASIGRNVRIGAQVGDVAVTYQRDYSRGRPGQRTFERRDYDSGHRAGYWRTVRERVCVPGYYEDVYVPAEYGWRYDDCGRRYRCIVRPACVQQVWHPERWEWRSRRVGWGGCAAERARGGPRSTWLRR